jgi:futalosine hydrolase
VPLETAPVLRRMEDMRAVTVGRKPAWRGRLSGAEVLLLQGGMGKSNAAQMLTAALETGHFQGVVAFGVAGAYAGSGLQVGSVAVATAEIYGDEGVETRGGWLSTEAIGIPLLTLPNGPCYNEMPLDGDLVSCASAALTDGGMEHVAGPFVTVSTCSGTSTRGAELARRFSAVAASMEGAACAHVAALYAVPFVEVRGVSNLVEDRDLERWRLEQAAESAARAVGHIVASW